MPGKSKEGGGLESSPVYKKQGYGEGMSPFTMRSGNTTPFKQMGSSPLKQTPITPKAGETYEKYIDRAFKQSKSPEGRDVLSKKNFYKHRPKSGGVYSGMGSKDLSKYRTVAKKGIGWKGILKGAGKMASRFLGPVGAVLTGIEAIQTAPKVVKATKKSLKKQAKTGQTTGFPKY
jgi:hypothetical protein